MHFVEKELYRRILVYLFLPWSKHKKAVRPCRDYYRVFKHFVVICNNIGNDTVFDSNFLAIYFELMI